MNGVSKQTFLEVKGDARWGLLYDILEGIHNKHEKILTRMDGCKREMVPRVEKLEGRKNIDTATSLGGGFLGGFVAVLAKFLFWK